MLFINWISSYQLHDADFFFLGEKFWTLLQYNVLIMQSGWLILDLD